LQEKKLTQGFLNFFVGKLKFQFAKIFGNVQSVKKSIFLRKKEIFFLEKLTL